MQVVCGQVRLVERSEPVGDRKTAGGAELQESVAVVSTAGSIRVEIAIACQQIDIALGIGSRTAARHPDPTAAAIGSVVEDRHLCQRGCVIADQPTVIEVCVEKTGPRNVNHAIEEQQCRTLLLKLWRKGNDSAGIVVASGACYGRRND